MLLSHPASWRKNQVNNLYHTFLLSICNTLCMYIYVHTYVYRAVVGGPASQAMARPVLGLSKQYIGLEIVINLSNYIAAYASNLLVHCLEFYFVLSYNKSQFFRLWNPFIYSSALLIVEFVYSATGYSV